MAKGGKRRGAGRKKGAVAQIKARITAASILDAIGERETWLWAIRTAKKKRDVRTVVDIQKYLTDRRDGKPFQAVGVENQDSKPFEIVVRNVGRRATSGAG